MDYARQSQSEQAENEWLQGIAEDPRFPLCWVQLGDFYAQTRQYPQSARCYQEASRLLPGDGDVALHLALVEKALDHTQAAADAAGRAAALLPSSGQAQALYGTLEGTLNNRPVALDAMRRAGQLLPDAPDVAHELARQEIADNDIAGAERDLAPYARAHPQDAEADYLMAQIALDEPPTTGNLRTGLDHARRAYASLPTDMRVIGVLGQLYLNAGQPAQALPVYLAGKKLNPSSEPILTGLIASYGRMDQSKEANALAQVLKQVNARHTALSHTLDLLRLNPTDTTAGLHCARLLEEDGQYRQAQFQLEWLVHKFPHDLRTHIALASFLRRMGRPDLAQQV